MSSGRDLGDGRRTSTQRGRQKTGEDEMLVEQSVSQFRPRVNFTLTELTLPSIPTFSPKGTNPRCCKRRYIGPHWRSPAPAPFSRQQLHVAEPARRDTSATTRISPRRLASRQFAGCQQSEGVTPPV